LSQKLGSEPVNSCRLRLVEGDAMLHQERRTDRLGHSSALSTYCPSYVLRQGFWHQKLPKLRESSAHLVGLIMRRAVCDASAAFRVSFV
jgi:hypothetical protein